MSPRSLYGEKILELDTEKDLPKCDLNNQSRLGRMVLPIMGILIMILIVLIVYLIYLNPFNYRSRLNIGPQSPYQQVVLSDTC